MTPLTLASDYWLVTAPVLLDTLAGDTGLSRVDVAELLVDVEQALLQQAVNPPPEVHDWLVLSTFLDLIGEPPHGKHATHV